MAKNIGFAVILLLWFCSAKAQADNRPPYLQFPETPPFELRLAPDSTAFSKHNLKKKKPLMIFLFSPDCDHCHHALTDLLAHIDRFKKAQIVMVSAFDFEAIKQFYTSFKIEDYPVFHVGRDARNFLGAYYKNTSFPAIYLYDKKGRFISAHEPPLSFDKIADELFH